MALPKTVAFVDYEHWFIGLDKLHRKPSLQAWNNDLKTKGIILEISFFGDFSENGRLYDEIRNIRTLTNRIIETKNTDEYHKKDYTDFIMLDQIYQKIISFPDIEQIVLFTGDGHFSSVAAYIKNFSSKLIGVYGIRDSISSQLKEVADWFKELPDDSHIEPEIKTGILSYLNRLEAAKKTATFYKTVEIVAERYNWDSGLVRYCLSQLLDEGIIFQHEVPHRSNPGQTVNLLKVNIPNAIESELWTYTNPNELKIAQAR